MRAAGLARAVAYHRGIIGVEANGLGGGGRGLWSRGRSVVLFDTSPSCLIVSDTGVVNWITSTGGLAIVVVPARDLHQLRVDDDCVITTTASQMHLSPPQPTAVLVRLRVHFVHRSLSRGSRSLRRRRFAPLAVHYVHRSPYRDPHRVRITPAVRGTFGPSQFTPNPADCAPRPSHGVCSAGPLESGPASPACARAVGGVRAVCVLLAVHCIQAPVSHRATRR
jgi:hypothetical protein